MCNNTGKVVIKHCSEQTAETIREVLVDGGVKEDVVVVE